MLRKLIIHEFKAVSKFLTLVAIFMIVITLVGAIGSFVILPGYSNTSFEYEYIVESGDGMSASVIISPDIGGMFTALYMMVYIAGSFLLTAGSFIYLWMRFHNSMYGQQGYLTNTLPTTPAKIIIAKLITATIWVTFSISLMLGSAFTLVQAVNAASGKLNTNTYNGPSLFDIFRQYGISIPLIIALYAVFFLSMIVLGVLMMYGSSAMGQLAKKHRGFIAIGCYFGMTMIINVITTFIGTIAARAMNRNHIYFGEVEDDFINQFGYIYERVNWIIFIYLILIIIGGIILFWLTNYVTSKRLNLE